MMYDVDDVILKMHENSLSDNPNRAAFGRLGKMLFPMIHEYLEAERERGTEPTIVIFQVQSVLCKAYAGSIMQMLDPHKRADFPHDQMLEMWQETLAKELTTVFEIIDEMWSDVS